MPMAAVTMTAPRVAWGRYCIGPVRNSRTSAITAGSQQSGELGAGAHLIIDRSTRAAGADREPLANPGGQVGRAHGSQFRVRVNGLAMTAGNRPSCEDPARKSDYEDANRRRQKREDVSQPKVGHFEAGHARRNMTHHRYPHTGQPHRRRGHDGQHDHDQWTRELGQ